LAKLVTGDLFQLHAVITAVACGMFGLLNTSFADIKVIAVASLLALGLKFQDSGLTADTVKDNAVQGLIAIVLTILAFVD
jgi:L-asparagine transporter-like permease